MLFLAMRHEVLELEYYETLKLLDAVCLLEVTMSSGERASNPEKAGF
jgi:hypothetical protein